MKPQVIGVAAKAGNVIEAILAKLLPGRDRPANKKLQVISHRSVGDRSRLSVRGRVVFAAPSRSAENGKPRSATAQLISVYRAFDIVEVPFATVKVLLGEASAVGQTDEAGFFAIDLAAGNGEHWSDGWHHPRIWVAEHAVASRPNVDGELGSANAVQADVFVPPPTATLAIVSDLDDTTMDTQSTHSIEVVRKVMFSAPQKRSPVDGVAELYTKLQRGADINGNNPICYISSGAWNLYEHIVDYLDYHHLPKGAVYLNDWGSRRRTFHTVGHAHKSTHVSQLLYRFPSIPFLLIGDDIMEDPELYAAIATNNPKRISAIWIRVVLNDHARLREIETLRMSLSAVGTELIVADNSTAFANHARERGWIS
ncbi:MAG: phosphatase domain-containing protein [Gemmatimonadaceae bacterium]